ncbi:MAG TPA: hypothetical protein VGX91_00670 [Candidatus Cybelea sp.]|nr:hypothetical protein [Candidatus Cybelea sp.]
MRRIYDPAVSVQRLGRIVLNKPAADKINEQGATLALIMWDEENHRFAVRPIFKKDPRAYTIRFAKGRATAGGTINAKTFLDSIGLDYSETHQYPAQWNADEGMLEVPLPIERFGPHQQKLVRFNRHKSA